MVEEGTTKELTPDQKAWKYLKTVIKEPEVYRDLKKGNPVTLTGNDNGKYILYPNGHVVSIGKDSPKLGNVHSTGLPQPDIIASTYMWITLNERGFKRNWGCGSIRLERNTTLDTSEYDRRAEAYERMTPEQRNAWAVSNLRMRKTHWWERIDLEIGSVMSMIIMISVMMASVLIVFPLMMSSLSGLNLAAENKTSTTPANGTSTTTSLTGMASVFAGMFPIIIVIVFVGTLIVIFRRYMEVFN